MIRKLSTEKMSKVSVENSELEVHHLKMGCIECSDSSRTSTTCGRDGTFLQSKFIWWGNKTSCRGSEFTADEYCPSCPRQRIPRRVGKRAGLNPNICSKYSVLFEAICS
jgi:hypothetical protein